MSTQEKPMRIPPPYGILTGGTGIMERFQISPLEKHIPAPSLKKTSDPNSRSIALPIGKLNKAEKANRDTSQTTSDEESMGTDVNKVARALGVAGELLTTPSEDEIVLILPTWGLFDKGEWKINPERPEVQKVSQQYALLAKQLAELSGYQVNFVGHTDNLVLEGSQRSKSGPQDNRELGFKRAISLYEYFFSSELKDVTRITFASQGDNVPLVPNASLDSERRKNRRVQIHLKRTSAPS